MQWERVDRKLHSEGGFTEASSLTHSFAKNPWYLIQKSQPVTDLWTRPQRIKMATVKSVKVKGLNSTACTTPVARMQEKASLFIHLKR